ncbi:MAG: hypothetical protein KGZ42_05750 [Melioribacter sp.]|nr:hypothetical protein [Melioribacter sp.]
MLRKLFVLALLFTVSLSVVIAQPRFDPKERAKELKERLKLDDKQTKQVEDIYAKQSEQMQGMFNSSGDREQMRDQMMKLREETNKKIEKILTGKQKAEYKKYQEEMQARRQQMRPGGN